MANAFSLFGELKVDTAKFTSGLNKAKSDLDLTTTKLTNTERQAASLGASFSRMAGPAMAAGAAIAVVGTAAIKVANAIFDLTKEASDFGSAIYDASQKTGLSATTLSALKYAAETSGSSFERITGAVTKFNILLGESALGNEKAAETLKKYGVTATDVNKALAQAITTIAQETDVTKQAAIAKALFKDRTAEILPVIKSFSGDLPGLIAHLQKLGITLTDEDAKAADEFGDTLDTLGTQAKGVGRQFAFELMPQITSAMQSISDYMAANKGMARQWGQDVITICQGVGVAFDALKGIGVGALDFLTAGMWRMLGDAKTWGVSMRDIIMGVVTPLYSLGKLFGDNGSVGAPLNITDQTLNAPKQFVMPKMPKLSGGGGGGAGRSSGMSDADKAAREAEQDAAKSLTANMGRATLALKRMWEELEGAVKSSFTAMLEYGGTSEEAMASMTAGMQPYIDNINKVRAAIEYLENSKRDSMNADQKAELLQQQLYRRKEDEKKIEELLASMKTEATKINDDYYDSLYQAQTTDLALSKARLDILKEINAVSVLPFENQKLTAKDFGLNVDESGNPIPEGLVPPLTDWEDFWGMMSQRMTEFRESLPSMKEAIGENLISGIMELGNVFGNAINDWIANGENFFKAIAKGFRQMVANIIGELVRLMVFQLLMKIIGIGASAAGGIGGGIQNSSGQTLTGSQLWGLGGVRPIFRADGGMISGQGTSTSDSILARLSNGEFVMKAAAVKKWGVDTLSSMNSGMMPAFAGGGLVGGGMSSVTTNAPVYNIHINGGGNNSDTVRSVKQGIREATRLQQREEWRRK